MPRQSRSRQKAAALVSPAPPVDKPLAALKAVSQGEANLSPISSPARDLQDGLHARLLDEMPRLPLRTRAAMIILASCALWFVLGATVIGLWD